VVVSSGVDDVVSLPGGCAVILVSTDETVSDEVADTAVGDNFWGVGIRVYSRIKEGV